jgi:hypothetical protein
MPDDTESPPTFEPVLAPPNGERVTQALLYKSLYELDQGLSERFTTVMDAILGAQDLAVQLRADFEGHRNDGHPFNQRAEIIKEEIRLDGKKAAIAAGVLAVMAAAFTVVAKTIEVLIRG